MLLCDLGGVGCQSTEMAFQSLFSWMLLCDEKRQKRAQPPITSFNPCSLGCCSVTLYNACDGAVVSGFNPCSLGCCSVTRLGSGAIQNGVEFQSLFSWMLLCDHLFLHCRKLFLKLFQSLFSWMLLCDCIASSCSSFLFCFNPCSLGCCSVTCLRQA